MNLEFELLQDKGDAPFAMDILRNLLFGLTEGVFSLFYLTIYYRKIRLRIKKIDAPKVNEPVRVTTGLTLAIELLGPFPQ